MNGQALPRGAAPGRTGATEADGLPVPLSVRNHRAVLPMRHLRVQLHFRPCPGRAVQVDTIKPTLKALGTKRLKFEYVELLSNFAFKFNLCLYTLEYKSVKPRCMVGRGIAG